MTPDFGTLFDWCDLHASRWETWIPDPGYRPRYFDRQGFPIPGDHGGTLTWALRMQDEENVIVARDELPDGTILSTVWLGLDHGFFGPPLIFETMRFGDETELALPTVGTLYVPPMRTRETLEFPDIFGGPGDTTPQLRHATEEEALASHHEILRRLRLQLGH